MYRKFNHYVFGVTLNYEQNCVVTNYSYGLIKEREVNNPMTENEFNIINELLNFSITTVPEKTKFWMIRTKKGYFYQEFIAKKFVALAWNAISQLSDFSASGLELLSDSILMHYEEIKRPTLVINKCKSFIYEIKVGDILVIPSSGSKYITFAYAGEYYEEESKTYELEQTIINKIEKRDVLINDVGCPYKKRRHITPIRTIKGEDLNYHLFKAISSYHGICNLDEYATSIIDNLYNCYYFKDQIRLVFHVTTEEAITSRDFSGFLYSVTSLLSDKEVEEKNISTQASIHSPGDIVFSIKAIMEFLSEHYIWFIAFIVVLGGGKFLTVDLPGIPKILKDIIILLHENERQKNEMRNQQLEFHLKALELANRLKEADFTIQDLENLEKNINTLTACSNAMAITPYNQTNDISLEDYALSVSDANDDEEEV